jgi:hypothetical protein
VCELDAVALMCAQNASAGKTKRREKEKESGPHKYNPSYCYGRVVCAPSDGYLCVCCYDNLSCKYIYFFLSRSVCPKVHARIASDHDDDDAKFTLQGTASNKKGQNPFATQNCHHFAWRHKQRRICNVLLSNMTAEREIEKKFLVNNFCKLLIN